jgi:hypothetical protein
MRCLAALCALALSVGYGALTSEFAAALVCTVASPMSVRDYLQTANDGGALLQAFSTLSPSDIPLLLTASRNPLVAATFGLSSRLQGVLPAGALADAYHRLRARLLKAAGVEFGGRRVGQPASQPASRPGTRSA